MFLNTDMIGKPASLSRSDGTSERITTKEYSDRLGSLIDSDYRCPECGMPLTYGSTFGDYTCECGYALWGPPINSVWVSI